MLRVSSMSPPKIINESNMGSLGTIMLIQLAVLILSTVRIGVQSWDTLSVGLESQSQQPPVIQDRSLYSCMSWAASNAAIRGRLRKEPGKV